jgi:subtilisin family serine protease
MLATNQTYSVLKACTAVIATAVLLLSSGLYAAAPDGPNTIKVVMAQQADVSGAFKLPTKLQRGQFVYNALVATAQQTQASILAAISVMGLTAKPYYIANFIIVQAPAGQTISATQMAALSGRSDVAAIEPVETFSSKIPTASAPALTTLPPGPGVTKNIQFVNAPLLWGQGVQGQGATIGIVDSGIQWNHPLLKAHYRGGASGAVNHNYNWWDSIHGTLAPGANPCGVNLGAPCDDLGHGTHVAGLAVGGNGTDYQIGVAPKAEFIACRDMDRGYASSGARFEECLQFMLAPWDLNRLNPDSSKAPDVIVHPYHCYVSGANCTDDPVMHAAFWNLYAAGITTVVASEDQGQICGTTGSNPAAYPMALVAGALDFDPSTNGPAEVIASYSGGGPGNAQMIFKPSVAAPGTNVLSAVPGGNVAHMSGTSAGAAHLAGSIALLLSKNPSLRGKPDQIWRLIATVPSKLIKANTCGSPFPTPNNLYGWGLLDANQMASNTQ